MNAAAATQSPSDQDFRLRLAHMTIGMIAAAALAFSAFLAPAQAETGYAQAFLIAKKATTAPAGATQMCSTFQWACAKTKGATPVTSAQMALVNKINLKINRQVNEVSDARQYGREEHWALPTNRGGDCEDFALLKKRELMKAGIPGQKLLIATVLDSRRQAHAVLVVRAASGDYVLDNLTNKIKHWDSTGYVFLRMQNADAPSQWSAILSVASKSA